MKWFIFLIACTSSVKIYAQEVQWASKVIDFSSQLSDYEYAAAQVLGRPNVLPTAGDNPNEWLPDRPDKISFIKVGFDHPMKIQQIAIAESYHPGSVYQVFVYDTDNKEYLINTFNPGPLKTDGRLMNIYFGETDYQVNAVKVVIDGSRVPGYNAIDAIGISGTKVPIKAEREMALRRNPGLNGREIGLGASKGMPDSHPVLDYADKTLFFTRGFSPQNAGGDQDPGDIWMARIEGETNQWSDPTPLGIEINNIGYNSIGGYYDFSGTEMLLMGNISGKVNKVTSNVVLVSRKEGQWVEINEQNIKNDHIASFDAEYTLAGGGNVLIISTERYDTEGGKDLYICHKEDANKWSEPQNMGRKINTAHDEYSPFFSPSENALYFSSPGYAGFGQGDIFRMVRLGEGWDQWNPPENIGADVNSKWDEKNFYFAEDDSLAYFARSDEDSIYHIIRIKRPAYMKPSPLVTLRGIVADADDNNPLAAELTVNLLPEDNTFGIAISDATQGYYEMLLPSGNEYRIIGKKKGYKPYEVSVDLSNKNQAYGYDLDILMASLQGTQPEPESKDKNEKILAANDQTVSSSDGKPSDKQTGTVSAADFVLFKFNSDQPMPESMGILNKIADFMLQHKDIRIEVAGFTDHIGSERFNVDLATRRAQSVEKYFIGKGINSGRIRVIGFGEKMPLILSSDIKDLQVNRRVEFNFTKY